MIYKKGGEEEFVVLLCAQSCSNLCGPMSCSLLDVSVHGIFQARILEWVTISQCRGSFQPRDPTHSALSCFLHWQGIPFSRKKTEMVKGTARQGPDSLLIWGQSLFSTLLWLLIKWTFYIMWKLIFSGPLLSCGICFPAHE